MFFIVNMRHFRQVVGEKIVKGTKERKGKRGMCKMMRFHIKE